MNVQSASEASAQLTSLASGVCCCTQRRGLAASEYGCNTAINDDEIDGYRIPAKSVISPYAAHRRPASWENPEAFDPERFTCARAQGRDQFAYFPFGGGPRLCLGKRFALMEAELILATVAQKWRLDLVPGPPIGTKPTISLRPRTSIRMTVHPQIPANLDSSE